VKQLPAVVLILCGWLAVGAGLPAPPHLLAMWNDEDGAAVHADLLRFAAAGDARGVTAAGRLDAGEAAYWLGVQHQLAGRTDSAVVEWRRAVRLRGDFDEAFALTDALFRRGTPAAVREARGVATEFVEQSRMIPQRQPDTHARYAWALYRAGHPDSALAEIRDNTLGLFRRPQWTRRFIEVALAAHDSATAWPWLVMLSAQTRRLDPTVEEQLERVQHALGYSDERRQLSVDAILGKVVFEERTFLSAQNGARETVRAKDGFPLDVLLFGALSDSVRRPSCLIVLSATDSLPATDSLLFALRRGGHAVALLAPRGSFGSRARGAFDPGAWVGEESKFEALTVSDALGVMNALAKHPGFGDNGWIVGGVGDRAITALEIARARTGAAALLLIAPHVPVVEIAEYRARLRALKTRTFVQVSPEEPSALEFGDLLAKDTLPGQVRVADSGMRGRGVAIFREDDKVPSRLLAWLEEKPTR